VTLGPLLASVFHRRQARLRKKEFLVWTEALACRVSLRRELMEWPLLFWTCLKLTIQVKTRYYLSLCCTYVAVLRGNV
jgi:hypothetical protein